MIAFDTNFLLRHILGDDPAQTSIVSTTYRHCSATNQKIYLNIAVILETVWTLQRILSSPLKKIEIIAILQGILSDDTFFVESKAILSEALTAYADGRADFSDYYIYHSAKALSATPIYSFDKKFQDLEDVISQ